MDGKFCVGQSLQGRVGLMIDHSLLHQLEKASRKVASVQMLQAAGYVFAAVCALTYGLFIYAYYFPEYLFLKWDIHLWMLCATAALLITTLGIFSLRWNNIQWLTRSVEQHSPGWGGRLSTAVETLNRQMGPVNLYSRIFVDGLKQEVERELETFDWSGVIGLRRVLVPFGMAAFFLTAAGVHAGVAPDFFGRAYRYLSPVPSGDQLPRNEAGSKLASFSIEVKPGSSEVPLNGSLMVQAQIKGGYQAAKTEIYVRYAGKLAWNVLPMQSRGAGYYDYLLSGITRDAVYFVQADGRQSGTFTIHVSKKFALESVVWEIIPPAYTGTPPQRKQGWVEKLTVPEGSTLKVRFKTNHRVLRGGFAGEEGRPAAFFPVSDTELETSFAVTENRILKIDLESASGEKVQGLEPVWIQTVPDLQPFIEILEPQIQNYVFATEEVPFQISVNDDYGISAVTLVLQFKGKTVKLDLLPAASRGQRELQLKPRLEFENYDLSSRDLVFAYVEVQDNYPGEPKQLARSSLFTFMIRDYVEQYKLNLPAYDQPSFRSLFEDLVFEQSEITREVWDYLSFLETEKSMNDPAEIKKGDA